MISEELLFIRLTSEIRTLFNLTYARSWLKQAPAAKCDLMWRGGKIAVASTGDLFSPQIPVSIFWF